jgi:hypothetical protein
MGLEDHAEVRRALELALDQRSGRILFIANDPLMDPIRREPWFPEILERAGLSS